MNTHESAKEETSDPNYFTRNGKASIDEQAGKAVLPSPARAAIPRRKKSQSMAINSSSGKGRGSVKQRPLGATPTAANQTASEEVSEVVKMNSFKLAL